MKKFNKNKFKSLYYIGLIFYSAVVFFAAVIIISFVVFSYNKIEDKHKAEVEAKEAAEKPVIPIVKQIIYDTIPVYDTIRPVKHHKFFVPIVKNKKDSL